MNKEKIITKTDIINSQYVICKNFNTKDWYVYNDETHCTECYFDSEDEAIRYIVLKLGGNRYEAN